MWLRACSLQQEWSPTLKVPGRSWWCALGAFCHQQEVTPGHWGCFPEVPRRAGSIMRGFPEHGSSNYTGDRPEVAAVSYQKSCTLVIPALGRLRREDHCKFEASWSYTMSSRQSALPRETLPQKKKSNTGSWKGPLQCPQGLHLVPPRPWKITCKTALTLASAQGEIKMYGEYLNFLKNMSQ